MENRFGVKDLFLFLMLVVLIAAVGLAMVQYDRQWKVVQAISESQTAQTRELAQLRRLVQEGVRVKGTAGGAASEGEKGQGADPFAHVKAAQANKDYATGDWLIDNFGTRIDKLTPLASSDVYSQVVQSRVLESLVYRDPDTFDYVPLLATAWQVKDNTEAYNAYVKAHQGAKAEEIAADAKRPDALTITFQLREGVNFSDGAPFTADDVAFTYEWIMNPAVAAPRDRAYYSKIRSVEKKGPYEVVFHFNEPYFDSLGLAGEMQVMPKHFYSRYKPEAFNEAPGLLMGTGPYMLKDPAGWRPGDRIELVRNERYWGEAGPFDRLIWYEVEGDAAWMTMFKNGEVDQFAALPEQYRELLKDKKLLERTQHFEYVSPARGYSYIAWNERKSGKTTPFSDKRVREAMTLLTNRQKMVDDLLLGYGMVVSGPFAPGSNQSDPSVQPWPYDPAKAKALLKEAGFEERNGMLVGPDGQPFRFKMTYYAKNEMTQRIALFLKDAYATAGIVMEPDPADWPIMERKLRTRDFDAITLAWGGTIEGDIFQMFHSSQIADQGDNMMSYSNPKLDSVIEQARVTVDEGKRMPLWHEAHRILHEDQPYTFLFTNKALFFVDGRVKNVRESKLGLNYSQRFVMPIPWYVPKALQKWGK